MKYWSIDFLLPIKNTGKKTPAGMGKATDTAVIINCQKSKCQSTANYKVLEIAPAAIIPN